MEENISGDFTYFFYHYFVEWHPVFYLYQMGSQYDPNDIGTGGGLAISILGIAVLFGLTRAMAELPGRRHGNMLLWWMIFTGLHIFAIPVYIVYEIVMNATRKHYQDRRQTQFADRTASEIRSGRKDTEAKHIP